MLKPIVMILFVIFFSVTVFAQIEWQEHPIDTLYDGAWGIFVIDMDGDKDLDIVSAAHEGHKLTWWENNGELVFINHTIQNYFSVHEVHAGDIDGDGDIDVVGVAYHLNEISWFENDGNMNFTQYRLVQNYNGAHFARISDMDNDGDGDILSCSKDGGNVTWWENDDYPNFIRHDVDNSFFGCRQIYSFDIDLDGDQDILGAAEFVNQVSWYENINNVNYQKRIIESDYNAFWCKPIDFDFDGDFDIIGCGDDISWWENDGYNNFIRHIVDQYVAFPQSVDAADIDLDNDVDIICASRQTNDISWWENVNNIEFTRFTIRENYDYAVTALNIDMDLDGDVDVLGCAYVGDRLSWWENTLDPTGIDYNNLPTAYSTISNFPNPFNSSTNIRFDLQNQAEIQLAIYNSLGQKIDLIARGVYFAGSYDFRWNAGNYPTGIYYAVLKQGEESQKTKLLLLK